MYMQGVNEAKMEQKEVAKIERKVVKAAKKKVQKMPAAGKQKAAVAKEIKAVQKVFKKANLKPNIRRMRKGPAGLTDVGRYLACLLDCDTYGPCHYPDEFDGKVALANLKFERAITINSTTGAFGYIVNPSMKNHFGQYRNAGATTLVYETQNQYQAPPLFGSAVDQTEKTFDINSSTFSNAQFPCEWFRNDSGGITTLGGYTNGLGKFIRMPSSANATLTVVNAVTASGLAPSFQITYGDGTAATAVAGATALANFSGFWLQAKANAASPKDYFTILDVKISIVQAGSTENDIIDWYDMPALNYLEATGTAQGDQLMLKYRVVAMNAWLEFEGNPLYSGGQIAAITSPSGNDPVEQEWCKYSTQTLVKDSQRNELRKGKYSWWKPDDQFLDMQWKPSEWSNLTGDPTKGPWSMPCIVHAGVTSSPGANAPTLTLKTILTIEYTTEVDFIYRSNSHSNPAEIPATFRALAGFPQHMENPLHVAMIADKIAQVIEKGSAIVQKYAPYIPAAMAAASGAMPAGAPLFGAIGAVAAGANTVSGVFGKGAKAYREYRGANFGKP